MKSKTITSKQVWQSPDGQKRIWDVMLEAEGKQYRLKTFSPRISEPGFEGEVESYLNPRGDRFVKQAAEVAAAGTRPYQRDDAIRAQWAIGQAIGYLTSAKKKDQTSLTHVEEFAKEFYAMVDRVKADPNAIEVITRPEQYSDPAESVISDDGVIGVEGRTEPGPSHHGSVSL